MKENILLSLPPWGVGGVYGHFTYCDGLYNYYITCYLCNFIVQERDGQHS